MQRSIVLRDLNRTRLTNSFGAGARDIGAKGLGLTTPEPRIDVEMVDHKGRAELARDPEVAAVCPEMPTRLIEPFDVPAANGDAVWGISAVGADACRFTGDGVVVAVLDTGIDSSHPAFEGVTIVEEDFSGSDDGDRQGHGTHCAGTIFGRDVDGERIGIARGVSRALIGKVLADDGRGGSEMSFRGIRWAVEQGAHVISMSLGFDFPGLVKTLTDNGWPTDLATSNALEAYRGNLRMFDALMNMIVAAEGFGPGAVVVAAAGNESRRDLNPDYEIAASLPAAAEGVLSVGAVGQGTAGLEIGDFSNTFPQICAPGVNVRSARAGGGMAVKSGTSMACPHVAGVVALWWEAVHEQGLPLRARTVVAKVLGSASTAQLSANVDLVDRGVGLVAAPG
jgi:subtilisin family serine protease